MGGTLSLLLVSWWVRGNSASFLRVEVLGRGTGYIFISIFRFRRTSPRFSFPVFLVPVMGRVTGVWERGRGVFRLLVCFLVCSFLSMGGADAAIFPIRLSISSFLVTFS